MKKLHKDTKHVTTRNLQEDEIFENRSTVRGEKHVCKDFNRICEFLPHTVHASVNIIYATL